VKFKITKIVGFDEEKERNRIVSYFNKTWQKRLLKILDSFIAGDYEKAHKLCESLPYCNKEECPGQEFISIHLDYLLCKFVYAEYYPDETIEKYE